MTRSPSINSSPRSQSHPLALTPAGGAITLPGECFMAETSEGHVESISEGEATLTHNPNARTGGEAVAPPHVRMEQLRARKLEIDDTRQ